MLDRTMRRHLFLTGSLSAGKTTVGQRLAQALGLPFFDIDVMLETRLGKPVERILAEEGEAFYRTAEFEMLREVCQTDAAVVALGAGTMTYPPSLQLLRERGAIVWLQASLEELWRRTQLDERFPRLWLPQEEPPDAESLRERMVRLVTLREPFYRMADLTVDTTGRTVDEVVAQIVQWLEEAEPVLFRWSGFDNT